jgi:predicted Zn-dependent protease
VPERPSSRPQAAAANHLVRGEGQIDILKMRSSRLFLVVSLLLLLAACTTNPATGDKRFTALMSPEQERQIGAQQHPRLVEEMGGAYSDPALQAYVADVGAKLVSVSETPDLPFTFTIVDTDDVNAFALPGGYVHVTRGLLALVNSEAELAGVLAHEIAHVVARHSAERYSRSLAAGLGAAVLGAIAGAAGLPAGVGDLAALGSQAYLQSYSRDQELEADMLGIRYLVQAGYEPGAMAGFLASLDTYSRLQAALAGRPAAATDGKDIMASHPRTADRIARAIQLAGQAPLADAEAGEDRYLARIDGLIYGDSPEQGLRVGRDFYHQRLRIAFRVPPGFSMINRPNQIIARGPAGSLIAFDTARAANMPDPATYIRRNWGGLSLTHGERIEVNGMEGAIGTARVQTRAGMADVRLVAIRADPTRLYRFIFLTPPRLKGQLATEVKRTVYSFRRLTEAEAAAVEPLRIRVVTVKPGDTPPSLAARMPFADYRLEHFLVLNQIAPDKPLKPGQNVKIVARGGSR